MNHYCLSSSSSLSSWPASRANGLTVGSGSSCFLELALPLADNFSGIVASGIKLASAASNSASLWTVIISPNPSAIIYLVSLNSTVVPKTRRWMMYHCEWVPKTRRWMMYHYEWGFPRQGDEWCIIVSESSQDKEMHDVSPWVLHHVHTFNGVYELRDKLVNDWRSHISHRNCRMILSDSHTFFAGFRGNVQEQTANVVNIELVCYFDPRVPLTDVKVASIHNHWFSKTESILGF